MRQFDFAKCILLLSVLPKNEYAAVTEMLKASNIPSYPLNIEKIKHPLDTRTTRSVTAENLREPRTQLTFIGDATRLWNNAPNAIRVAKSISIVKKEIKKYCKELPI